MGLGLAQTAASKGFEVIFKEPSREGVERAFEELEQALDREIERWAITVSEKKAWLSRIRGTDSYNELLSCELVIEAIQEDLEKKCALFQELDIIFPDGRVFVTNTSTLSVSQIANATKRRERVIGMHFLRPVPRRSLVEIVRGVETSDETYRTAREFAEELGKTAIEVFEYPGYVTTRVILPLLNEAMHVVMEGVASAEDIDKAMRLGYDLPAGPLEMADRMGLDEVLTWMERLLRELGDPKYRPCPLLRKLVRAGHLGEKTGKGLFRYDEEGKRIPS
jgi:3-hydroxybutyryl-CoA dehydrogenase